MVLWSVLGLMTAAAVFAVLWPLSRRAAVAGGSDIAVYRDQLDEIERDRATGLIAESEAEAAKIEVSRRLIAAADGAVPPPQQASSIWPRRAAALAGLLLLPVGTAALYLLLGWPQLPGEPLAARLEAIHQNKPIEALVSQVEARLERNPNDVRGYEVLAPVYMKLGRYNDAANADRKAMTLSGETAERQADLGEALMAAANGVVTHEAKAAFDRSQALDPREPKSRFYIGVAAEQDGDRAKAAAIWRGMLAKSSSDAPWIPAVQKALARVSVPPAAAPGPGGKDIAAAADMSEKDRSAMIHAMMARLADRLKHDGGDIEGWQRLLRAYMVMGERDKAHAAAVDARRALASEPDKLRRIDELIKGLGLQG